MPSDHAAIGGSTISRVLRCPGSVRLAQDLPRTSSPAADRGTMLHAAMERVHAGEDPARLVGFQHTGQTLDHNDARRALLPARAALGKFVGEMKARLEVRVVLARRVWGTADILAYAKGLGKVGDFKFGANKVEVAGNEQALFYAAAALESGEMPYAARTIELGIIQPGQRPVLQTERVKASAVVTFGKAVKTIARVALSHDAAIVPGEKQCEWCPVKKANKCPAHNEARASAKPDLAAALMSLAR